MVFDLRSSGLVRLDAVVCPLYPETDHHCEDVV